MNLKPISILAYSLAFAAVLVLGGCFSVNSDIEIGDGATVERSLNTVNGRITIGRGSTVRGDAKTVNGRVSVGTDSVVGEVQTVNGKVELGNGAKAESVEAVNGSVEVGEGVEVGDRVETVNGRVVIGSDSIIGGRVESVNGQIRLSGATVGALRNVRGGMVLEAGSRVMGELRVARGRSSERDDPVLVEIHADCEVLGPLVFQRPVRLRVHRSAQLGEITGAEPEYFDD
jgi:acyl-[acyl carrier protein]--UDP-N-acetylglucosamine O-acyltransferase